ncbi:uncharacterized protein BDW47DRAFT_128675 [Aspergillus candidus]|uniref:Uncharacterized protein n=1 Tax=Aspergillus candidus TaxID=41067 RepID=A0A2I2F2L7_ASPCN|nr:hypothetical protein BDW47DRAFT_128675 [Aspergillus candidus]PLB34874.1 hypothetical protein BDW47DRAFT_128675 [Aspergillus candidus]
MQNVDHWYEVVAATKLYIVSHRMSHHARRISDETYEVYDPSTVTTPQRHRQQPAAFDPAPSPALASHPSNRSLRRTSRLPLRPPTVDVSGRPRVEQTIPVLVHPIRPASNRTSGIAALRPALSEPHTEDDEDPDSYHPPPGQSYWPRHSNRVSPHTASAILWTLEEATRKPFPFTTDWEEVNSSMADLMSPTSAPGYGSTGRTQNGAARAAPGPVPVNPHPPSGVRTPTDIMRQRRDREARRKAEQDARDQEQGAGERRPQDPQDPAPTRAPYPAGVAGERPQRRGSRADPQPEYRATAPDTAPPGIPVAPRRSAPPLQPPMAASNRPPTATGPPASAAVPTDPAAPHAAAAPKQPAPATPTAAAGQPQQPRRVAFPHAFERWETLSSHWEGLTSYWIRKLEQNNEAMERDPISQQMARQVTDLSAAGANLFHAVVELQRLRASSERKFQRWFFETRAEQERSKEVQAELDRQLRAERQARAESLATFQKTESDRARMEGLLKEMRRELQISKEEARRAWEELGRREQEERDRTTSLRNGEPTIVGGVQVVPMIQGLSGRSNPSNRPPTHEAPYDEAEKRADSPEGGYYEETPVSPTVTDPFTEGQRAYQDTDPQRFGTQPPPATTAETTSYYSQTAYAPRPTSGNDEASSEPGEDEYDGYRRDPAGAPIVYPPAMSEESDEFEQGSAGSDHGYPPGTAPTTSAPLYAGYPPTTVDYTGSSWGEEHEQGWEAMTPRHRHPTRLSDVLEEEEPRTTPSRASVASRSVQ